MFQVKIFFIKNLFCSVSCMQLWY